MTVVEIDPAAWVERLVGLLAEVVGPFFFRREPRLRARAYMLGLFSGLERENRWSLAEFAGESTRMGYSGC